LVPDDVFSIVISIYKACREILQSPAPRSPPIK
jgi:hypothetical protein